MQYQGGKHFLKHDIGKLLMYHWREGMNYYEPFVGGANVLDAVRSLPCEKFASDASPDLIALWQAVKQGWEPPDTVTEDEYAFWKSQREASAMRGFVGYGCSFGGKFFGGYARDNRSHWGFAKCAKDGIMLKSQFWGRVSFKASCYSKIVPPPGSLVYCDPPYTDTTGYKVGQFNSQAFWSWVRSVSKESVVLVSEFTAPADFKSVMQIDRTMNSPLGKVPAQTVTEHVFQWRG